MLNIPVINRQLQHAKLPSESTALLVFFSAHWCPPCRGFTPLLKMFYSVAREAGAAVEIVFVSSDRSEREMIGYYQESHGEWLAVPYFSPQRQFLSSHFNVRGIPALVLVNRGTYKAVDCDVRSIVQQAAMAGSRDGVKQIVNELRERSGAILFDLIPRSMSALTADQREGAFDILSKIVRNIAENPTDSKYRQLKCDNGVLRKSILDLPCGDAPLLAVGFHPGGSQSGVFTYRPSLCDIATAISIIANRESNGLSMLAAAAPVNRPRPASAAPPVVAVDSKEVKYRIFFRDMKPQVTDAIPSSEPLGVLKAIAESVTEIASEHHRLFSPSLYQGALEAIEDDEQGFPRLLGSYQSSAIDVLVIGQHTRHNKIALNGVSDEEGNARAAQLRGTVIGSIKPRFVALSETNQILNNFIQMQIYEVPSHQLKALECVPVMDLHKAATNSSSSSTTSFSYEENLFKELLKWFKRIFFKWIDKPPCCCCGGSDTLVVNNSAPPIPLELKGLAARTEIYSCKTCGGMTRFPRFNHPVVLLTSRQGRCGEWANCFTLIARSMGFEMRRVYDSADHVWTEVWMDHRNEWVHCDPCEEAYDTPLLYESGWKKQATLTLAVSKESVADVTKRYTANPVPGRFDETLLQAINEVAINHWAGTDEERMQYLFNRISVELDQLKNKKPEPTHQHHLPGRTTGSVEWRSQRGELGSVNGGIHPDTVSFSDDENDFNEISFISKVSVWSDQKLITGIHTEWTTVSGSTKSGTLHLGSLAKNSAPAFILALRPHERIVRIIIRCGDMVDYIRIETSEDRWFETGNINGGEEVKFDFSNEENSHIVGFRGGLARHMHNLDVITRPLPDSERIKNIFTRLVAQGKDPNDAALEALEIIRSSKK